MRKVKKPVGERIRVLVVAALVIVGSSPTLAGHNANMQGVVTDVLTYPLDGRIFFRLSNQPSSHPVCTPDYFSIDASVPDSVRSQLLSRLLVAYTTGETITIGFDSQGDCSHSRIRVHRIG